MIAALGIGSLAIGFAFKDVFENFMAGILILYRRPMRIGDYIECDGVEGKVEKISIRDTHVRRTDGQLVVMPNGMLFRNPVEIRTDRDIRRVTITAGVAYDEDVDASRDVITDAVKSCDTVRGDQPVQIFAQAFGASSIDFEVTWWTGSTPLDVRRSRDEVVAAVKRALDEAGIEIPFPYRTLTFKEPLPLARAGAAGSGDGN
jgi:small-conductance mechanosensitive channel